MSEELSGFGSRTILVASVTFPFGIELITRASDIDPFDTPSVQIADTEKEVNGSLISWKVANPIPLTLSFLPNSFEDINLTILAEANRPSRGKFVTNDIITITNYLPSGNSTTYNRGIITDAQFGQSLGSNQRLKSKSYVFSFESLSYS